MSPVSTSSIHSIRQSLSIPLKTIQAYSGLNVKPGTKPAEVVRQLALSQKLLSGQTLSPREAAKLLKSHQALYDGIPRKDLEVVDLSSQFKGRLGELDGYREYMQTLEYLYSLSLLSKSGRLQFIDIPSISPNFIRPKIEIKTHHNAPGLRVLLRPINGEEQNLFDKGSEMLAPLLLRDVSTWAESKRSGLGDYPINRLIGVPEDREFAEHPSNLSELIANNQDSLNISDQTPVVEGLGFLPIAADGKFLTQFMPEMFMEILKPEHKDWKFTVVVEDKLSAWTQMMNIPNRKYGTFSNYSRTIGLPRPTGDIEDNLLANFVPDMTDIDKLFLKNSAGHMVIIATPTKGPDKPPPQINDNFFGSFGGFGGGDTKEMGGGASIGAVQIGRGRLANNTSTYTGDLQNTKEANSMIYHFRFLGVKPDQLDSISQTFQNGDLERVIDSY